MFICSPPPVKKSDRYARELNALKRTLVSTGDVILFDIAVRDFEDFESKLDRLEVSDFDNFFHQPSIHEREAGAPPNDISPKVFAIMSGLVSDGGDTRQPECDSCKEEGRPGITF